jgi:hypothetical protein
MHAQTILQDELLRVQDGMGVKEKNPSECERRENAQNPCRGSGVNIALHICYGRLHPDNHSKKKFKRKFFE